MNADRLLKLYDRIADAPDAIVRLRRFVLDLAVRGKLVEQDPSDEPASELLKRIAAEKARLVKTGDIKKPKPICLPEDTAIPVPANWRVVPLGEVINSHLGGGTPSKNYHAYWGGDIRWASVKDVGKSKYLDETIDRITNDGLTNSSSNLIQKGNLIVVTRMGLGQLSINRVPVAINQDLRALFLSPFLDIDFVYNFFLTYGMKGSGLTVKGIKIEELLAIPFPLPPLAEQHRIVAKVDELMALLDRLEEARTAREATRDRLTAASLARLTASETDAEAFPAHARFALDALPVLTARPDQIKQLRQTILNLAVRGKLVEQDPADEPASELFDRIHTLKGTNVEPGEMKREARFASIREAPPFELPETWFGVCLRELAHNLGDGLHGTPEYSSDGECFFINGNNLRDGSIEIYENTKRVSTEECAKHAKPLSENTVLVSINGTLGNVAFYQGEPVMLGKSACYFELSPLVLKEYMKVIIHSPYFMEYAFSNATGATIKNLSLKAMNSFPVPLPPFAEQHRIVAKVDALMALCDRLEATLATADTTRQRLLEALLHEALSPGDDQEAAA